METEKNNADTATVSSEGENGIRRITHETDLCVIGGGLTGLCAAIAAAREGVRVILMQDRPVLGGNASSEVRMWVRGAHGEHNRETGIISELEEENIYGNPRLNYSLWDGTMWAAAKREKNLTLLLNCSCCDAEKVSENGKYRLTSVTGWQITTYTWHTVRAKYFADCSGDSILAPLSGARWRVGREASAEYGESIGREVADKKTMGMSCLIQARQTDSPVTFIAPEWAYRFESDADFNRQPDSVTADADPAVADANAVKLGISSTSVSELKINKVSLMKRPHKLGTSETNFWWIELGGEDDSIHDAEDVRDELLRVAYGIWDHLKNRGGHAEENLNWDIEWIGFLPGKRESRRYIGNYVLTQNDIESGGVFDDIIAYGGWPMDDHNPAGFRSYLTSEAPSKLYPAPSPYGIPYRVLFGDEVANLFFAGRNISATHAALSSTRVMATCALIGQALGVAAGICINENLTPYGVYTDRIGILQSKLLDAGCYLPGHRREIPSLSLGAKLNISDDDRHILFNGEERPDADGKINYITLPIGGELTFDFDKITPLHRLRIMFDRDFSRKSISVNKKMRVFAQRSSIGADFRPVNVAATLVRGFAVYADGREVWRVSDNHTSLCMINLDGVSAKELRIVFESTNGSDEVHIFSADVE